MSAHGQQSLKLELEAPPVQPLLPVLVSVKLPTAVSVLVGFAVSIMHSLMLKPDGHTPADIQ